MRKSLTISDTLIKYGPWAVILGVLHAVLVSIVYNIVPDAYMDEIFHIGQTRRYCQGNYTWDPMITTPPGLYILALPLFCGRERYVNSVLFPLVFLACCRLRSVFSHSFIGFTSLIVVCLPVLLHSSILFYTDLLSLFLTIVAFPFSPLPASFFFFLSLFVRQTNIAWAFLYACVYLFSHISPSKPFSSLLLHCRSLWPFIIIALSFISFIVYNDGRVVLGDASAHVPVLHLPQLLYFSLFSCIHTWPVFLAVIPSIVIRCFRPSSLFLLFTSFIVIYHFTLAHPYLLADNRHIPFYLYRRLLSHQTLRLLLLPLYLLCLSALALSSSHLPRFIRLFFIISTAIVLIPSHLIEFRYFITPFILLRLSVPSSHSIFQLLLELLSNISVFSFVFLLFLFKPFEWSHQPGELQRFMW